MTTSTITFKPHAISPSLSTTATTLTGMFNLINNYFVSLAANPDCHWEVCSFSVAAHPFHLVLKRKSGAPGRILLMGIVTSVTTNYNPQLLFAAWTSVNSWRAAYFPNATSDVPANLLSPSGDVFTTPAGATGMGPAYSVYTGTECWKLFSCEQGIILRLAAPGITSSMYLVVGDMGEDYSENAIPLAGWMSNFTQALQVAPSSVSQGFATQIAGSTKLLQISLIPTLSYNTLTRNLATKESAYFPFILGNPVAGFNDIAGYKLRQFGRGPSPLAGNEILYSTGPVAESYATSEVTTDGFWVVNRKV